MIETLAKWLTPLLNLPYVLRVRRNHGLEHATIHLLNRQRYRLSGVSSGAGFLIYGDVPTEKLETVAHEALKRLNRGEKHLAIHPNCGTNLVVTGGLMTIIGAIGFVGTTRKSAWERFPLVLVAMMFASLYALPLGLTVQRHLTTTGEMGDLKVLGVVKREFRWMGSGITVHQVITG